jgi:hypothetical protein
VITRKEIKWKAEKKGSSKLRFTKVFYDKRVKWLDVVQFRENDIIILKFI